MLRVIDGGDWSVKYTRSRKVDFGHSVYMQDITGHFVSDGSLQIEQTAVLVVARWRSVGRRAVYLATIPLLIVDKLLLPSGQFQYNFGSDGRFRWPADLASDAGDSCTIIADKL